MATFADLQTRVFRALIDTPTAVQQAVPDLINEALHKLQGKHDFNVMQTILLASTTVDTRELVAVPEDFKSFNGDPWYRDELGTQHPMSIAPNRYSAETVRSLLDDGPPSFILWTEQDDDGLTDTFEVYPLPDGNSDYDDGEYRVVIPYYRYLPRLVNASDTNWFLRSDAGVEYIVRNAIGNGFELNEDEVRADRWYAKTLESWKDLLLEDKYRQLSLADTLVPHLGAKGPKFSR